MDLSSMLKTGKNIDISLRYKNGESHNLKTRVDSTYENGQFSILSPMENGVNFMLPQDTDFPIIFEEHSELIPKVYKMSVKVINKQFQKNQLIITLEKTGNPEKIERRQTYRLQLTKTFSCTYEGNSYDLLLKDMSITGLKAIINKRIPIKQFIEVHLNLGTESSPDPMTLKAQVINCDKLSDSIRQHDIRMKFVNIYPQDTDRLSKFIVSEQSKILHAIHESKLDANGDLPNKEHRHQDDKLVSAIPVLGLISWIMTLITIGFFLQSRPEQMYNLDYFYHLQTRQFWDQDLLNIAILCAEIELAFCVISLILNSRRHKRKEDRYHKGLILNLIISLLITLFSLFIIQ